MTFFFKINFNVTSWATCYNFIVKIVYGQFQNPFSIIRQRSIEDSLRSKVLSYQFLIKYFSKYSFLFFRGSNNDRLCKGRQLISLLFKLANFEFSRGACLLLQSIWRAGRKVLKWVTAYSLMLGIPQGCNLRPLLSTIFINDL